MTFSFKSIMGNGVVHLFRQKVDWSFWNETMSFWNKSRHEFLVQCILGLVGGGEDSFGDDELPMYNFVLIRKVPNKVSPTTGHYKMENLHTLKIVLAHTHFTKQFFTSLIFTSSILQKRQQWSSGGPEILPNDICIIVYLYISSNVWKTITLTTWIPHVECYISVLSSQRGCFFYTFWGKSWIWSWKSRGPGPPLQCHPPKKSLALPSIEDSLTTGSFFLPGGWVEVPLDSPWYEAIWTANHMLQCDWGWNHLCSKVRDWSCRSLLPEEKNKTSQPTNPGCGRMCREENLPTKIGIPWTSRKAPPGRCLWIVFLRTYGISVFGEFHWDFKKFVLFQKCSWTK